MSEGTADILSACVHNNAHISAVDLSNNTENDTSVLVEIDSFYFDNETDTNAETSL